ncbi:MAG: YegS/Rv2252/BmrU family lipid kinase [Ilumatobacteraceae bacterium]
MTSVAVVAHQNKNLGGGLAELRQILLDSGVADPLWFEVAKSSEAPKMIRRSIKQGADLIFVWGGDGMVQRSVDAVADTEIPIAILPAGTANLLATNLGIPKDLAKAVDIGLNGTRRRLDVGVLNGERFAVMAGAGFDARIMGGVDQKSKQRFGRLAYFKSGLQAMKSRRSAMTIKVNGEPWFDGKASCVLFGNVGTVSGGLKIFPEARPDDGVLEIGVVTAKGWLDWLRVLIRVATRQTKQSTKLTTTHGRKISVRLGRSMRFELDGGARKKTKKLKVRVVPDAIYICVPDTKSV